MLWILGLYLEEYLRQYPNAHRSDWLSYQLWIDEVPHTAVGVEAQHGAPPQVQQEAITLLLIPMEQQQQQKGAMY
jgi:hypothetical protein